MYTASHSRGLWGTASVWPMRAATAVAPQIKKGTSSEAGSMFNENGRSMKPPRSARLGGIKDTKLRKVALYRLGWYTNTVESFPLSETATPSIIPTPSTEKRYGSVIRRGTRLKGSEYRCGSPQTWQTVLDASVKLWQHWQKNKSSDCACMRGCADGAGGTGSGRCPCT